MTDTDTRIMDIIAAASDIEDTKMWDMRKRHYFEMQWLRQKQEDRRANDDKRSPIKEITVPPDLFKSVEIKRVSSSSVEIWIGDRKVSNINEINIQLLPIVKPKVILTQTKTDAKGYPVIVVVDGKQQIVRETIEVLASSLTIDM
jgi:hypothetical protein